MTSQYDASSVYQFLTHTPEGALRKMLITPQFTAVHFNMLFKVVRSGSEEAFCEHFYKCDFPKAKFNAQEIGFKETFWPACVTALNQHGLLQPAQKVAA
jgi:hypothetical protein